MRWSTKYDKCQNCGTSERRHCAKGLCKICWEKQHYINNPDKLKKVREQKKAAAVLKKNGKRRWAINYVACVRCGLTKFPHEARGLCKSCEWKRLYADPILGLKFKNTPSYYNRLSVEERRIHNRKRGNRRYFGNNKNIVLDRDGHKCCKCGCADGLVIHHIDGQGSNTKYPNNDLSNLQTLCRSCHAVVHAHIDGWSKKYACCIVCGKTDRVHSGYGRCVPCAAFFRRTQRERML